MTAQQIHIENVANMLATAYVNGKGRLMADKLWSVQSGHIDTVRVLAVYPSTGDARIQYSDAGMQATVRFSDLSNLRFTFSN